MNRKYSNQGVFSSISIPMQKRSLVRIAKQYNVDISGLTLKIQRDETLLNLPFLASTDYNNIGRIDFYPNAFKDEETLIKTLLHEKCHVKQLQRYGKKYCQDNLNDMEKQAYRFESIYYYILKRGKHYE